MEPALRRGDRDGVGGGSRMLRLHAQLISASVAARMSEIELEIDRYGLRRHRLAAFWFELRAASVLPPLARRTRLGRARVVPGKRGAYTIHVAQERAQERDGNTVTRTLGYVLMTIFA